VKPPCKAQVKLRDREAVVQRLLSPRKVSHSVARTCQGQMDAAGARVLAAELPAGGRL